MVLSSTTLQTLVTSYLADSKTLRYFSDEGIGCFEYAQTPSAETGLQEYNCYRLGDEPIQTKRLVDDDDEGSEISNDPVQISAECEAALKTIIWNKTAWQTRVITPTDILTRVLGRERAFVDELTTAYPGLKIQVNQTSRVSKGGSTLANPVESSLGLSKIDDIRLSSGAYMIEMSHDDDKVQLAKAKVEMEDRVAQFRKYAAYTHFLSLPVLDQDNISFPNRQEKFCKLLDECEYINISSEIVQPAARSHITLLMLRLYSEADIAAVIKVLQRVATKPSSHQILFTNEIPEEKPDGVQLPPKGFNIKLKGLYAMDEDPAECRVLFTKEDTTLESVPLTFENQRLLSASTQYDEWLRLRRPAESYLDSLIEDIASEMLLAGLIDSEELVKDRLVAPDGSIKRKLHITIINGKYRRLNQVFDARPLLENEQLANFDFGTAVITGLHISKRGQAAPGTHYYTPEFIIPIRPNVGL